MKGKILGLVLAIGLTAAAQLPPPSGPPSLPAAPNYSSIEVGPWEVDLVIHKGTTLTNMSALYTNKYLTVTNDATAFFQLTMEFKEADIYNTAVAATWAFVDAMGTNDGQMLYSYFNDAGTGGSSAFTRKLGAEPFASASVFDWMGHGTSGFHTRNGTWISPTTTVWSSHYYPDPISYPVQWCGASNDVIYSTVGSFKLGLVDLPSGQRFDLSLAKMNTAAPDDAFISPILNQAEYDLIPDGTPCVMVRPDGRWCIHQPEYRATEVDFTYTGHDGIFSDFDHGSTHLNGESGCSSYVFIKGEWHLVGKNANFNDAQPVLQERMQLLLDQW